MGVVISNDVFLQKRMRKEYETLYQKYRNHPYPDISNNSIHKIASFKNVKAIVSHMQRDGTVDSFPLFGTDIVERLSGIEFDYEFISNSILKLIISNFVTVNVYFSDELPEPVIDDLTELLEIDIISNYRSVDINMAELRELHDKIYELSEIYVAKYDEPISKEEA